MSGGVSGRLGPSWILPASRARTSMDGFFVQGRARARGRPRPRGG